MSRFHNLEFGEPSRERREASPALDDEAHHAAVAREAFEGGQFQQALRAYAKVLEHNPRNAAAWAGQVRMLVELGECGEALRWADKGLEMVPEDPELLAAKAVALAREGDTQAALAYSDAAISVGGGVPYVWLARADVLLARRENRAEYCVEKALALAGSDWLHLWLASRIHAFYRQFGRALQLAQRALETTSDRAVLWLQVGLCRRELGLVGSARSAFETALQLDGACVAAERALGSLSGGLAVWMAGLWRRWFGN